MTALWLHIGYDCRAFWNMEWKYDGRTFLVACKMETTSVKLR